MKIRRGIVRVNYMAQDRQDLSTVAKVMSQYKTKFREGVVPLLKRCARCLKKYRSAASLVPRSVSRDTGELVPWTDSDWAGDVLFSQIHKWRLCTLPRCSLIPLVQNAIQRCAVEGWG